MDSRRSRRQDRLRRWRAAAISAALSAAGVSAAGGELLKDAFTYGDRLITNEYAYWNHTAVITSPWEMGSGSFFSQGGAGWTGVPDDVIPNQTSSNGTNSAVFRLNTIRSDFGDVAVSLAVLNQGLSSTPSTPAADWDGLHIWLRYQNEQNLYYASFNRRDNTSLIKKKVPGGPSNGGAYYVLGSAVSHPVPYGAWQRAKATVKNNANGSVTIALYDGDKLLVTAVDDGAIGGPPIRASGKVGLRADNANLKVDDFTVSSLDSPPPSPPPAPGGVAAAGGDGQAVVRWSAVPGAVSYNLYRSRFPGVTKANGYKVPNVTSPKTNTGFTNGTTYYMVVTAMNAAGESVESAQVSAVPMPALPAPPTGVRAVPGDGQAAISWDPAPGAVSYNLYRSRFPGVTKANGYKIENVTSPRNNTGFVNGTSYYMVVTAVNAAGESAESAEVSVVPAAPRIAAAGAAAATGGDAPRAFPNPWRADAHGQIPVTFDHLMPGSAVKIFTADGRLVADLPAREEIVTWDLSAAGGGPVASGFYLYRLVGAAGAGGQGVLAVIR